MDERIVQLISSGDARGLAECQRYYGALMRYVIEPILESPEDQEDCIQNVLYTLLTKIGTFDPSRGSFKAWLAAVTRNTALKMTRREKRTESYEELSEDIPSDRPGAEEQVLRKEMLQEVRSALSRLPERDKQIIYRRYYFNQPVAQIAAELGMTERAAEGRLYRIKKKLRDDLGGGYFNE